MYRNEYMVEGRLFASVERARAFATRLASEYGRTIAIMEHVPGLPWHVMSRVYVEPEEGTE